MKTVTIEIVGQRLVDAYNAAVEAFIGDNRESTPYYYEAESLWSTQHGRKMYKLEFPINPSLGVFVRPDGNDEVDPKRTYSSVEIEAQGWINGHDERFIALFGAELNQLRVTSKD